MRDFYLELVLYLMDETFCSDVLHKLNSFRLSEFNVFGSFDFICMMLDQTIGTLNLGLPSQYSIFPFFFATDILIFSVY